MESFATSFAVLCHPGTIHELEVQNSGSTWDNFDLLWASALSAARRGEITHFVMLHADVEPELNWLDILLAEMDRMEADMISVVIPIKDPRGVTTCGIGDPNNRWAPWRRFTVRETAAFPPTFSADDTGYPGWPLLHNHGCFAADLRKEVFFRVDQHGTLRAFFDFPRRVYEKPDGSFALACESEDWYFSRCLYELGAKTFATTKVKLNHATGSVKYPNFGAWGDEHDEESRFKWGDA